MALFVASPAFADTVVLGSDADTYVRYGEPGKESANYGGNPDLFIRQNDTAVRDFFGYVRIDLSVLGEIQISDATLTLTKDVSERNDEISGARFALYGLEDVAGNTSQNWPESSTSFNSLGSEISTAIYSGSPAAGLSPFDSSRVTDLDDDVPGITENFDNTGSDVSGGTVSVSGAPLVSFLQDRADANGLATFIIDYPTQGMAGNEGYGLATKENATVAYRPGLLVVYTELGPPSPPPPPAAAAYYYVATTGSDSNPGTEALPFASIARGQEAAAAGDTVWIRGGVYEYVAGAGADANAEVRSAA